MMRLQLGRGRRYGDRWRGECPFCGAEHRRDDALSLCLRTGRWFCHRCQRRGCDPALAEHPTRAVDHTDPQQATERALAIFEGACPIQSGSVVDRYLTERALVCPPNGWSADMRHARQLRHPTGARADALVVLLRDVMGTGRAVIRTWLDPSGHKASVTPQRAALGCMRGCAAQLAPLGDRLALAEGVEDALAVTQALGIPAWATCGAPGMRRVELPRSIRDVVIVPDRDGAGVHAARELAYRLRGEGRSVSFRWPEAKDAAEEVARAARR